MDVKTKFSDRIYWQPPKWQILLNIPQNGIESGMKLHEDSPQKEIAWRQDDQSDETLYIKDVNNTYPPENCPVQ